MAYNAFVVKQICFARASPFRVARRARVLALACGRARGGQGARYAVAGAVDAAPVAASIAFAAAAALRFRARCE